MELQVVSEEASPGFRVFRGGHPPGAEAGLWVMGGRVARRGGALPMQGPSSAGVGGGAGGTGSAGADGSLGTGCGEGPGSAASTRRERLVGRDREARGWGSSGCRQGFPLSLLRWVAGGPRERSKAVESGAGCLVGARAFPMALRSLDSGRARRVNGTVATTDQLRSRARVETLACSMSFVNRT